MKEIEELKNSIEEINTRLDELDNRTKHLITLGPILDKTNIELAKEELEELFKSLRS